MSVIRSKVICKQPKLVKNKLGCFQLIATQKNVCDIRLEPFIDTVMNEFHYVLNATRSYTHYTVIKEL